jgi:nucleotide-binding universal stress UspA family protein
MKTTRAKTSPKNRPSASSTRGDTVIELVPSVLKLKSILVPLDFSKTSQKALVYAFKFAEQFGAKLTLLAVVEPFVSPDFAAFPLVMEPEKVMSATKDRLDTLIKKAGLPARLIEKTLVRHGSPFLEITEAARTLKVDMIIITTHGHSGLKHILMGSTAERVVRHAPCPVLVVRENEREFA